MKDWEREEDEWRQVSFTNAKLGVIIGVIQATYEQKWQIHVFRLDGSYDHYIKPPSRSRLHLIEQAKKLALLFSH